MNPQLLSQKRPLCRQTGESLKAVLGYLFGAGQIRSLMASGLLWCCSGDMLAAGLTTVKVNEPGEWRPFAIGQLVASLDTGGPSYWRAMPQLLRSTVLEYFYLTADSSKTRAEDYGKLDFAVVSDGPVWMLTTARFFNSGNPDGNWQPEVITQAKLEADGWRVIARDVQSEYGYEPPGENESLLEWLLFERTCKAGQQFSIRTEKYQSPVILRDEAANDLFVNRMLISGLAVSITSSNVIATREVGEPNHAGNAGGKSIWWTWKAPQNGTVTISTAGSAVDTVLAVYTGTALGNLRSMASNDDDPGGGMTSFVKFRVLAGVAYQIAVDTFGGQTGMIRLGLRADIDRPVLRSALSGKNVVMSWPTNALGFALEEAEVLGTPTWSRVPTAAVLNGTNYSVKLAVSSGSQFYRLKAP